MIILKKNLFIIFFTIFRGSYYAKETGEIISSLFLLCFHQISVFRLPAEQCLDRCKQHNEKLFIQCLHKHFRVTTT